MQTIPYRHIAQDGKLNTAPNVVVEWNAPYYSGVPGFKSRPGDLLSSHMFSWLSSVHTGKCRDGTLKLGTTASFHMLSISYFTFYPFIRRCIVLSYEKASLNKLQMYKR
jgi:hypothetical protein